MTRCSNHLTSRVAILAIAVFLAGSSGSAPANADPAVSPNSKDTAKKEEFVKRLFAGPVAKQKSYVLLTGETVPEFDGPDCCWASWSPTKAASCVSPNCNRKDTFI